MSSSGKAQIGGGNVSSSKSGTSGNSVPGRGLVAGRARFLPPLCPPDGAGAVADVGVALRRRPLLFRLLERREDGVC